jgi:hypothetical protein
VDYRSERSAPETDTGRGRALGALGRVASVCVAQPDVSRRPRWRDPLFLVRWVLPSLVILAGFVVLVVRWDTVGVEAFALLVGAGLSIWLLNFLYRLSVSGDRDRDDEDRARRYFDEHGHWPDEPPPPHEVPAHRPSPSQRPRRGARTVPRRRG